MMEIDDLFELAFGQKGIQWYKSQRLVIAAIRQLDMMMKLHANIKVTADDMAALPLTKPIYKQNEFDEEFLQFHDRIFYSICGCMLSFEMLRASTIGTEFGTQSTRRLGSFSLDDAELDSLWCSTSSTPSSQSLSGMD